MSEHIAERIGNMLTDAEDLTAENNRLRHWLHVIAEPVKPERSARALQEFAVCALQGAEIPAPQCASAKEPTHADASAKER